MLRSPSFGWEHVGQLHYVTFLVMPFCSSQEHVAGNSVTIFAALLVSQRAMQNAGLEKSCGSRAKPEHEHQFEESKIQERSHQCRDSQEPWEKSIREIYRWIYIFCPPNDTWPNFWRRKLKVCFSHVWKLASFFFFKANPLQTCGDAFGRYLGTLRRLVGRATLQRWWTPWETRIAEGILFQRFWMGFGWMEERFFMAVSLILILMFDLWISMLYSLNCVVSLKICKRLHDILEMFTKFTKFLIHPLLHLQQLAQHHHDLGFVESNL